MKHGGRILLIVLLAASSCMISGAIYLNNQSAITINFVGDVMLGRQVGKMIQKTHDPCWPFRRIGRVLINSDITIGNLECVYMDRLSTGEKPGNPVLLPAFGYTARGLAWAGFDALSLANNHSLDFGPEGLNATIEALRQNRIQIGGISGRDPLRFAVQKREVVVFNCYCPKGRIMQVNQAGGYTRLEPKKLVANLRQEKAKGNVVVVCIHWEDATSSSPTLFQRNLAHWAIDAGADLVVGHGTHTIQTIEEYHGGTIAYSLGNLVFDQKYYETQKGLILTCRIKKGKGVDSYSLYKTRISSGTNYLVDISK